MALNAQGTTLEISEDGGTTWVPIGCIQTFGIEQPDRAEIDVTCLTSSSKEYKFGLRDSGTVTIEMQYDPEGAGQVILESSYASDTAFDFKIEYNNAPDETGTGTLKEFKGFVISISESGAVDDVVTESVSIKITGDITITPPVATP